MARRIQIPLAVKREVLIEACYRCAVPLCRESITIDVHHIDGDASNNDTANLVVLCPTCHAAFHRKKYSVEAIKFWKLLLRQLNASYDRNTINLLLMLGELSESKWDKYEVTGDGLLAFAPLLAGGLIDVSIFHRAAYDRAMPYYEVRLSERGRATMKAWKEGDPSALQAHHGAPSQPTCG